MTDVQKTLILECEELARQYKNQEITWEKFMVKAAIVIVDYVGRVKLSK